MERPVLRRYGHERPNIWVEWIDYETYDMPSKVRFSLTFGDVEIWLTPVDRAAKDEPHLVYDSQDYLVDHLSPNGVWMPVDCYNDAMGGFLARRHQQILVRRDQLQGVDQQAVKAGVVAKWDELQYLICRIRSGEHGAWWRVDGNGYTNNPAEAWWLPAKDAFERTSHCGPEKLIKFELMPSLRPLST